MNGASYTRNSSISGGRRCQGIVWLQYFFLGAATAKHSVWTKQFRAAKIFPTDESAVGYRPQHIHEPREQQQQQQQSPRHRH